MINFRKFDAISLLDFGIVFDNPEEAEQFVSFVRKELNKRIDERVITDVTQDKLDEFKTLNSKEETQKWISKNCPQFKQIRKEEYVKMAWEIFTNQDRLKNVTIISDNELNKTPLVSLELSEKELSFFSQLDWITIADVLNSHNITQMERLHPDWFFNLKSKILDVYFPPKKSSKKQQRANPISLDNVFEEHKNESCESVLDNLYQYILDETELFRNGIISENEFYINTYPILVANKTFKLKNNATIKTACAYGNALMACWKNWKAGNKVIEEPWMSDFIHQDGNMEETITWFFEVCDKLAIPIIYFFDLQYFSESKDEFESPKVIKEILGETEAFLLTEKCTDIEKLNSEASLIGKSFELHFDRKITAHLKVLKVDSNIITCEGVIDGYMSTPGRIEIKIENDKKWFYFDKRMLPRIKTVLQAGFHPIPHPKWKKYNEAIHKKGFQFEAEYKQLRLPFMLDS